MTASQRSRAAQLIAAKGQTVTLTRRAAGSYDTATGASSITATTQTGTGVVLPMSAFRKASDAIVVEGDRQLLLSALTSAGAALTAPVVDDTVTLADGSVASIVAVDPLSPAGMDLIYDCTIRKAA
ncbi:MAG: hypothetical protein ACEQR8_04845 [Cypionkella sp.]